MAKLLFTFLLLCPVFLLGSGCVKQYSSDTPQAKSAKLLSDHKMEVASIAALSLVYYCKNEGWPPQNTLASRNRKLSHSFSLLKNYTDINGQYHLRFKFKAPPSTGLTAQTNPEWEMVIPNPPSEAWAKGPIFVPVTLTGTSDGKKLDNIKSARQFKAECKPDAAWAQWMVDQDLHRFQAHQTTEDNLNDQTRIAHVTKEPDMA